VKDCWTADAKMTMAGMPDMAGVDAITKHMAAMLTASPDMTIEPQLELVNGNTLARVVLIKGTNTGPMMVGTPMEQKATGKKWGLLGLAIDMVDDTGKIKEGHHYMDAAAMMGQLGLMPGMPVRPAMESGTPAGAPVIGAGTDPSLAVVKAGYDAMAKGDMKAWGDILADDVVITDMGMPEDVKGKEPFLKMGMEPFLKMMEGFHKGFPDMKMNVSTQWSAGEYVVTEATMTGKNTGAMPDMGIKKATNKEVNVHVAEIAQVQNGKVVRIWWFGNGMEMAMQLGLMGGKK
jgi:predicted ester cyclase